MRRDPVTSWLATLVWATQTVRVEAHALGDDVERRRLVGHVIERMLEVGIAVDPRASTRVALGPTDTGYAVTLQVADAEAIREPVDARGREAAVVALDVVQVAVDLAREHAESSDRVADAVFVEVDPAAEDERAALLAALAESGAPIVPTATLAASTVCLGVRDDGIVAARVEPTAACDEALAAASIEGSVAQAVASLPATLAVPGDARPEAPTHPVARAAPPAPASDHAHADARGRARAGLGPWDFGLRVGLGFGWRPRSFDAAPSVGFDAAARRGLAVGFDVVVLPSRNDAVTTVDTQLASALGYRASFARGLHLSASAAAGVSLHASQVGGDRGVRIDPLLALPLQIERDVHRHVSVGARLLVATTFRGRAHAINGIEVWRRGPVLVMLAGTVRFGTRGNARP